MTEVSIPKEALEAAAKATHDKWRHDCAAHEKEPVENWLEWHELTDFEKEYWRREARAACLAMLKAWPGGETVYGEAGIVQPVIYLPLPKEKTND